jgi:exopolyphosphatase / guanosine-5'-triphosphate,3'-diphosphate pyrophosphatase
VEALASALLRQFAGDLHADETHLLHRLAWAAKLHEIGLSVAHNGYHKHSAYIVRNADMPGFSKMEQSRLATLVLAHRGSLDKMQGTLESEIDLAQVAAMRLAALFYRSRVNADVPSIEAHCKGGTFRIKLDPDWLRNNPLTAAALADEVREWRKLGVTLEIKSLQDADIDAAAILAE